MSFVRRLFGRKTDDVDETAFTPRQDQARPDAKPQPSEVVAPPALTRAGANATAALPEEDYAPDRQTASDLGELSKRRRAAPRAKGLRVGYASDVGQLRDHNEDTLIVFQGAHLGDQGSDPFGFFVVTDGMGGHRAGEVASSLAARLVSRDVLKNVYLPFLLDEKPSLDMAPITEILKESVQNANDQVHERVPGGGTTLTCALILGQRAYIAHVGDSRAYLLTNYDMRQVTQDHSYVGRLIELGELSPEEAAVHPQRHVLYRAIGQGDNLDIDTYHQPLPPRSRLLLCSDGLSGVVSEEEIGSIIASAATPQDACERLLAAANAAGGPDNITAVLIETSDA
jgi:serine/threonine protein phosphatase PrpC